MDAGVARVGDSGTSVGDEERGDSEGDFEEAGAGKEVRRRRPSPGKNAPQKEPT